MTEKAVLLLFELVQARAQPLQPLSHIAQILRPIDFDRMREIGSAHLSDRLVELAERTRDQQGKNNRQRERNQPGGERQITPRLASFRGRILQSLDLTLGETIGG